MGGECAHSGAGRASAPSSWLPGHGLRSSRSPPSSQRPHLLPQHRGGCPGPQLPVGTGWHTRTPSASAVAAPGSCPRPLPCLRAAAPPIHLLLPFLPTRLHPAEEQPWPQSPQGGWGTPGSCNRAGAGGCTPPLTPLSLRWALPRASLEARQGLSPPHLAQPKGDSFPLGIRSPRSSGGLPIVPREGTSPCSCSMGQAPLPGLPWKKPWPLLFTGGQSLCAEVTPAAVLIGI